MSDRKLDVPKPKRTRDVTGFGTPSPPAEPTTSAKAKKERAAPSSSSSPRTTAAKPKAKPTGAKAAPTDAKRSRSSGRVADDQMVRIHATVSPAVADALRRRVDLTGDTHTEVLAEAFVSRGSELSAGDSAERAKYEDAGFRPKRPKRVRGRMTATFYVSVKARSTLDRAATAAGFASRSAFIDALLRAELDLEEVAK
ncbi:MAG: hypothetical protein OEU32_15675 [Acidimicrobiia bacterium]|nr:hypothetical protein [Acidimicrobiia bacterium]